MTARRHVVFVKVGTMQGTGFLIAHDLLEGLARSLALFAEVHTASLSSNAEHANELVVVRLLWHELLASESPEDGLVAYLWHLCRHVSEPGGASEIDLAREALERDVDPDLATVLRAYRLEPTRATTPST